MPLKLVHNSRVAVIGGGISGLSFVYFLSKLRPDLNFTIYEQSNRLGGYINTEQHRVFDQTVNLEKGPRTLRGASDGTTIIVDVLIKLGYKDFINVIPSNSIANKKYLLSPENELIQVPNDWGSTFKFLRSSLGKGLISGALTEIFKPKLIDNSTKDESVESFLTRRFGKSLPNNIISAVFNGIYAADIGKLSAKTTLKSMYDAELENGSIVKTMIKKQLNIPSKINHSNNKDDNNNISSILSKYESYFPSNDYKISHLNSLLKKFPMIVLQNGLESLPKLISKNLIQNNKIKIIKNDPIISITKNSNNSINLKTSSGQSNDYSHVRSTVNSQTFSTLLNNGSIITSGKESSSSSPSPSSSSSMTASIASELKFINIFLINLYIKQNVLKNHGFGYLIPKSNENNERVLGVIFDSDIEKSSTKLFTNEINQFLNKHDVSINSNNSSIKFPEITSHYSNENYTKLTIMMGGHYWSNMKTPSMEKSIIAAKDALSNQLGLNFDNLINGEDYYIDSIMIPNCLPQFHIGYDELKRNFLENLKKEFDERISVGGMSFGDGAGVPDCVVNGFKDAERLARERSG